MTTSTATTEQHLVDLLHIAESGYPILPIKPHDKIPLTSHGLKDATTDPKLIPAWFYQNPAMNWAMRATDVIDIDVDGADGKASLEELKAKYQFVDTWCCRSHSLAAYSPCLLSAWVA